MVDYEEKSRFEWKHSYSRVYEPKGKYTPDGIFMSFEHYNVEVRDRVKCISGMEGESASIINTLFQCFTNYSFSVSIRKRKITAFPCSF